MTEDAKAQDLAGIDAMLSSLADDIPTGVRAALSENSLSPNNTATAKTRLTGKFHCATLRPHQLNKRLFEAMPGYQKLAEACRTEELGAAFTLSVQHFKPGPDKDGLYKIKNPEALVVVRADLDKEYKDSSFTFYPDVYAGTTQVELGLNDTGFINLPRTLKLTTRTPQKQPMRLRLKQQGE